MTTQLYISLPLKNLDKSVAFFHMRMAAVHADMAAGYDRLETLLPTLTGEPT